MNGSLIMTLPPGRVRNLASQWEDYSGSSKNVSHIYRRLLQDVLELDMVNFTVDYIRDDNEAQTSIVAAIKVLLTDEKYIDLIFKTVNRSTHRAKINNLKELFRKECLMYTSVVPELSVDIFPTCYHATDDVIVLENLMARGYHIPDRRRPLDVAHCKLALSHLGRFHASAHISYTSGSPNMALAGKELLYSQERSSIYKSEFSELAKDTISIIRSNSLVSKYSRNIEEILNKTYENLVKCLNFKGKFLTLTHGELCTENLMFSYNNTEPLSVKMLDLQMCRMGSPLLDFIHLLYTSTEMELRDVHMDDLLRTYHWSLCRSLRQMGSDVDINFIDLRREMESLAIFGLIAAHLQPHDDLFQKRISDVVLDLGERAVF